MSEDIVLFLNIQRIPQEQPLQHKVSMLQRDSRGDPVPSSGCLQLVKTAFIPSQKP